MSKFSHDAADDDDARAITIPRRFLRKQPSLKCVLIQKDQREICAQTSKEIVSLMKIHLTLKIP